MSQPRLEERFDLCVDLLAKMRKLVKASAAIDDDSGEGSARDNGSSIILLPYDTIVGSLHCCLSWRAKKKEVSFLHPATKNKRTFLTCRASVSVIHIAVHVHTYKICIPTNACICCVLRNRGTNSCMHDYFSNTSVQNQDTLSRTRCLRSFLSPHLRYVYGDHSDEKPKTTASL